MKTISRGGSWWRRRWVMAAAVLAVIQIGVIWWISLPGEPGVALREPARQSWVVEEEGGGVSDALLWVWHPGLVMESTDLGFSGRGWLVSSARELAFDPLTVGIQPLPFVPPSSMGPRSAMREPRETGPAHRWSVISSPPSLPRAAPLPWPLRTVATVVSDLGDWRLAPGQTLPLAPQGEAVAGPVVVRVAVDGAGRVAAPVVVWRGSGVVVADELACEAVAGLRFERVTRGEATEVVEEVEEVGKGWVWGRIRLDWGWSVESAGESSGESVVPGGGT